MKTSEFIENQSIKELVQQIPADKNYSDTIDEEGFQYVDLVQEGGGTLGIALLGYTYILEKANIRYCSLAGTSAGAINSILLASIKPDEGKTISEKVLSNIADKNFMDFVDGEPFVKKIVKDFVKGKKWWWILITNFFGIIRSYGILKRKQGLNPGKHFEAWLKGILDQNGIKNTGELLAYRKSIAHSLILRKTNGHNPNEPFESNIVFITSEIIREKMVKFPEAAPQYFEEYMNLSPSKYVRTTMSIPIFFEPVLVQNKNGELFAKFVDGGVLSNFPMAVFHRADKKAPRKPTLGIQIGNSRNSTQNTDGIFSYLWAIFNAARHQSDYTFWDKNRKDFEQITGFIDVDENRFNWLDFNLNDQDKFDLFKAGAEAAIHFLQNFDWERYKAFRESPDGEIIHNILPQTTFGTKEDLALR